MMQTSQRVSSAPACDPASLPAEALRPLASDTELMCQARDGDVAAFETLFRKHGPQVVELASHFVRTRNRAEEIAQNTFLQVFRERARYTFGIRFSAHLSRVATNLCLSEVRRSASAPEAGAAERHLAPAAVPARLRAAVDRLSIDQKVAFLLARLDDVSYADIAETLETSPAAVKMLVFTAMQTVRATLQDLLP